MYMYMCMYMYPRDCALSEMLSEMLSGKPVLSPGT